MVAPLDYDEPRGETIKLALIRHRAQDPDRHVGSLFFNPGGPGGAGSLALPAWFGQFPTELVERFDIVSWDPRGIGHSTAVQCFDTEQQEEDLLRSLPRGFPVGPAEEAIWIRVWEDYASACGKRVGKLLAHISTADSARDLDLLRRTIGDRKLSYIGVSYGTLLGATYANLFPDKVRALVLDGNLDPVEYFREPSGQLLLSTFIRVRSDTASAATLERFLTLCGTATPARCAFSAGDPAATHAKFDTLLTRMHTTPVTISGPNGSPEPYNYARAVTELIDHLSNITPNNNDPHSWAAGAQFLQDLWVAGKPGVVAAPAATPTTPPPPTPRHDRTYISGNQGLALLCAESPNPRQSDLYPKIAEFAVHRSGPVGEYWTWTGEGCASWPAQAVDVYTGPWNHPTSAPILVIGNAFDPRTNYQSSRTMAGLLANARLLTIDGYGHTTLLNRSSCANHHEIEYLLHGTLPPPDTHCPQDTTPFTK